MGRRHIEAEWGSAGDLGVAPSVAEQEEGWVAEEPPFQEMNWLQNLFSEMLEHIEQNGISDWSTETAYTQGAFAIGSDRALYRAVIANQAENPVGNDGTEWALFAPVASEAVAGIIEIATQGEVNAGADDTKAITSAKLEAKIANESNAGVLRTATNAEAQALTNAARAITPSNLGSISASTVQRGIIALATLLEVATGTNNTKAVTPLSLASLFSITSETSPNFRVAITLPNNILVQFGKVDAPGSLSTTVEMLSAYATADDFEAFAIPEHPTTSFTVRQSGTRDVDEVQFTLSAIPDALAWFAIGLKA